MAPSFFSSLSRFGVTVALSFVAAVNGLSVSNKILILAPDATAAANCYSGLQGYGIPYEVLTVPSGGATLPTLSSDNSTGNYGAIVTMSELSYAYGSDYRSALTTAQWQQLYDYQTAFGVRMVRLDVYPNNNDFGVTALGGTSTDQPVSFTNTTGFSTAGLKTDAAMSMAGLYHYPSSISNSSIAWEIASFAAGGGYDKSTAAVINNIGGRQQMAFFLPFSTDWSATSNFLQHAWIHFATRGVYAGFRRLYFSTQIDDMFLETDMYRPVGNLFRIRPADLAAHKTWTTSINSKMPSGSSYFIEVGHNGNGDIEASIEADTQGNTCKPDSAIEYDEQIDTPLEFQKPLGTGTDIWPATPKTYTWSLACASLDTLMQWWATTANRDAFGHVSHTFTHESLNNATYSDTSKEISFNQAWMKQVSIDQATKFSSDCLIPPAITGLHNGDAIKAWMDNGIKYVVGDNTRPVLRNSENLFWPLISNVANNGYDGLVIVPRWATTIYYNCDLPDCTTQEWIDTSAGSGDFNNLLADARSTNSRNLLGLHWDPYMFHQANMRQSDVPSTTVNGESQQLSLLQTWVETVVNEMARLTEWPMITKKFTDIAQEFTKRMARDGCNYQLAWNYSNDKSKITGATLTSNGNTCSAAVPVTFPGAVSGGNGVQEQVGSDPLTVWATLSGSPVTFTLNTPIAV